jgi:hypothetical protein
MLEKRTDIQFKCVMRPTAARYMHVYKTSHDHALPLEA